MATSDYEAKIDLASENIRRSSALLTGGGAGLSAAAGLDYSGPDFRSEFADYIRKYGFTDLYSSGFYNFPTEGERWARWARHVDYARFRPPALPLYLDLLKLVKDHDYFVITTNVDGQFFKAGFDPGRIFAVQGDYGLMQCSKGCHDKLYPNKDLIREMLRQWSDFTIPASLVPSCPVCGANMYLHLRKDRYFVENADWHRAGRRYGDFLARHQTGPLVLIEAGVGFNTPGIIRYPFEEICLANREASLIRINRGEAEAPRAIRNQCIIFDTDIAKVIADLLAALKAD